MKSLFRLPVGITRKKQTDKKNKGRELPSVSKPDISEKTVSGRRFYLVDFENVGTEGIDNAYVLGREDYVHLFCTVNSAKICPSVLASFNTTNLTTHIVPQGDQSVDMHLVSYLGYLLGKKRTGDVFTIISKDKDYDNVITFWKKEQDIDVKRIECLAADRKALRALNGNSVSGGAKLTNEIAAQKKQQNASAGQTKQQAGTKQANLQQASGKVITKQQTSAVNTAKQQTSAVNTARQQKSPVNTAKQQKSAVNTAKKQTSDTNTRQAAKSSSAPVSASEKNKIAQEKVALNNAIAKALSQAKFDNTITGFVSSQAAKHFKDANRKQRMHAVIVQKYGQDMGLKIYKCIRQYL